MGISNPAVFTKMHRIVPNSFSDGTLRSQSIHAARQATVPLLLWAAMWANLDTGYWNIAQPTTLAEWVLLLRAVAPFAVLPFSVLFLTLSRYRVPVVVNSPNRLLLIYGCVATIATVYSPAPGHSIYWSITFLAALLCTWALVVTSSPWITARMMLEATWAICFVALVILAYLGRGSLFSDSHSGDMAYGISAELNYMSRSSGVGRWAAIPGLVFFIRAFFTRRAWAKVTFTFVSMFCLYVVYRVQSRGAVFGVLGALLFVFLTSGKVRRPAVVLLLTLALVMAALGSVGEFGQGFEAYIYRGQNEEEFGSMSGRTRAYEHGLVALWESPIIGMGQWSDRLNPNIAEHIHNSFLQAGLNGGILGFLPYAGSWICGWILFLRLWRKRASLLQVDQRRLLEAGMVMSFFTLRAVPETTTASFAVDLMVMTTVYCYFDTIAYALARRAPNLKASQQNLVVGSVRSAR